MERKCLFLSRTRNHKVPAAKERPAKLARARKLIPGHLKEIVDGGWQETDIPMLRGK